MEEIPKADELRNIVCRGLEYLRSKLAYRQNQILAKLETLDQTVSAASLTNIKQGKKSVGSDILKKAAIGIEILLKQELDMVFDSKIQDFRVQNTPGWTTTTVPEKSAQKATGPGFTLHQYGRVSVAEKTNFIDQAEQEVIEVGIRLNSFVGYFFHQNENAYKTHIMALLEKGVNVKGYLLDPDSNEARIYFEDRAKKQAFEKDSIGEIKKVIEQLKKLCQEFEQKKWKGKFEIFLYKHIPYNLFLVVDGAKDSAKMMVSHYMYGVTRANCPVLEFTKKSEPLLYRRYMDSMQAFLAEAKKLT